MMKSAAIFLWASVTASCASQPDAVLPPPEPAAPSVVVDNPTALDAAAALSGEELDRVTRNALAGNSAAAFRLAAHMGAVARRADERMWLVRAAELGNPVAQYNMWVSLRDSKDCSELLHAKEWLRKSAAGGFQGAVEALQSGWSVPPSC